MTRLAFEAAARAGAVQLLSDYAAEAGVRMQVYRARVRKAATPTAYVEGLREELTEFTLATRQRTVSVLVRCLWGRYDDGDAADARDTFVDGFLDWCADNPHAFGANSLQNAVSVDDDPEYDFDGDAYYSTVITLEGLAAT